MDRSFSLISNVTEKNKILIYEKQYGDAHARQVSVLQLYLNYCQDYSKVY